MSKEYLAIPMHRFCTRNREAIERSTHVGCFSCETIFHKIQIDEYTADGCAICPDCWVDSILPDTTVPLSPWLLKTMRGYWFSGV